VLTEWADAIGGACRLGQLSDLSLKLGRQALDRFQAQLRLLGTSRRQPLPNRHDARASLFG
jgi:hypothetical protein